MNELQFLADRMAILLCVCKQRHTGSWVPWFQEGTYEDEGLLGDEIREWPEYQQALNIVRLMLRKYRDGEKEKSALEAAERETADPELAGEHQAIEAQA